MEIPRFVLPALWHAAAGRTDVTAFREASHRIYARKKTSEWTVSSLFSPEQEAGATGTTEASNAERRTPTAPFSLQPLRLLELNSRSGKNF